MPVIPEVGAGDSSTANERSAAMEIKKDDLVRVTTPSSVMTGRVGRVTEIADIVDRGGDTKHRYQLQFSGQRANMWYFDYEVEQAEETVPFSVRDLVQYRDHDMLYEVIGVDHDKRQVDVKTIAHYSIGYYGVPAELFKLHIPHNGAQCSTCGQTIEHNAQ